MQNRITWLSGLAVGSMLIVPLILAAQNREIRNRPSTPKRLETPMKFFMHGKLTDSHDVFDALVQRDFKKLQRSADSLRGSYQSSPALDVHAEFDDQVYEHFHLEFMRLCGKLTTMAENENLEGGVYVYQNLTSTCISCHEHLRDRKTRKPDIQLLGRPERQSAP